MAATSSATTSQVQAQPRLIRIESQIAGIAEGTTIRCRMRRSGISSVRPRSRNSRGTDFTLSMKRSTCWKKVPMKMIRNFCVSVGPAQRMVKGTKATTGM